jgi:ornithine carbamoyltransferase
MDRFLTIGDASAAELVRVIEASERLRAAGRASHERPLTGRCLATVFEKPSLRTRVSFEQAMGALGGRALVMGGAEVRFDEREAPEDAARVLAGLVDVLGARVHQHATLERLAAPKALPVINLLSDKAHPCQALADVMTLMEEFGTISGRTVAFVGDGNNVARSLASLCARLGLHFVLASPGGYGFEEAERARLAEHGPGTVRVLEGPAEAVEGADAVYTDTWVSMGQEDEAAERTAALQAYQLNEALLEKAPVHAIVLHCLPAKRGAEITDAVLDGPRSRVFRQAHNRLHAQKGLLAELLAEA